ncbi:hypothetical protein A9995_00865 [Erythrobacter sp. QSSC1-22B]|uniref:hypothetical protein n=1 Tax=Erythrobacter sp. QSSC1-22B TaxID=1860125 RepID=UPI000805BC8A|nr:hypothetical protein [Erythrobacter sp. QSSC1-22B]OBX20314.1 hypothetical protein A9995_00865 [Erythrobacter sp. QSSC1-22B]
MIEPRPIAEPEWPEGDALRLALARGDRALGRIGPILGHLLSARDQSLFSDAIVARVRGMLIHLARQVLRVQAEATGHKGREQFADEQGEALAEQYFSSPLLVAHCHALALEWRLASGLEEGGALDPVLSPLMQSLIGREDTQIASAAMAALAAQARFAQSQRRMELPMGELPGDLLHEALLAWRAFNNDERSDALARAESKLRSDFDEGAGRLSLLDRMVTSLGSGASAALTIDHGGVALFLSALALRSGQSRDIVALSTNEQQAARLALSLRAAGLKPQDVEAQLLRIHPHELPPQGLEQIGTREAAQLLAQGAAPAPGRGGR